MQRHFRDLLSRKSTLLWTTPSPWRSVFALVPKFRIHGLPLSRDRKSTRLNSSHVSISYAVFCLKKKTISYIKPAEAVSAVPENMMQQKLYGALLKARMISNFILSIPDVIEQLSSV